LADTPARSLGSPLEVLLAFTRLGLTSFGGPVAHLGYFRAEFVDRRKWLDDRSYADLVGLCQFLPGPASSQTGIGLGLLRAGIPGAIAAWTGFTLPSAILMAAFGTGLNALGDPTSANWLHGLKIVAVAVVAQAVWTMARNLWPDRPRATIGVLAALLLLLWPVPAAQIAAIVFGAAAGRGGPARQRHGQRLELRSLAGYGAAQAVPGPLTTFSAFLGASRTVWPNGPLGAAIALVAVFLPSFLLVFGCLPFWGAVRGRPAIAAGMRGVNAAVVGILLAALYTPVWTSAITKPADFALAVAALALLVAWKLPPWLVVVLSALTAAVLGL
jgi:chromate transporter